MSSVHLFDKVCCNEKEFTFMHYKKKIGDQAELTQNRYYLCLPSFCQLRLKQDDSILQLNCLLLQCYCLPERWWDVFNSEHETSICVDLVLTLITTKQVKILPPSPSYNAHVFLVTRFNGHRDQLEEEGVHGRYFGSAALPLNRNTGARLEQPGQTGSDRCIVSRWKKNETGGL